MFRRKKKLFSFGNSTYDADKVIGVMVIHENDSNYLNILLDGGACARFTYNNKEDAKEDYQIAVALWKIALGIRN
jgi:hypothetical protein